MRIQIKHELLSDSPMDKNNAELFTNIVNKATNDLIQDILNGMPTCYLISGYRGSGKTSFIKKIYNEIENISKVKKSNEPKTAATKEIDTVFVYTNFAKYKDQLGLLRKLIRALYLEIKDRKSFQTNLEKERSSKSDVKQALLLAELYDKTFNDVSYQTLYSNKFDSTTKFSIDYVEIIKAVAPSVITIFFLINFLKLHLSTNYVINFVGFLVSLFLAVLNVTKLSKEISKTKIRQNDYVRKSLYDNEVADYHLFNVLSAFKDEYRIVFVLDELDKIPEGDVDVLLEEMKPYLVSGICSFIIVAGQDLFYKYSEAQAIDDALLSSMFSKIIHIPLFSRIQFQLLFKSLIKEDEIEPSHMGAVTSYVDFLIFESKRIPRKFINLVRQTILWDSNKAFLYLDENGKEFQLYSKLNDVIDRIYDREIATESIDAGHMDYFLMQLYLLTRTILSKQIQNFTFNELDSLYKHGDENKLNSKMKILQRSIMRSLLYELTIEDIIESKGNGTSLENFDTIYRLKEMTTSTTTTTTTTVVPPDSDEIAINNIFEILNIARSVYQNLGYKDSSVAHELSSSQILETLEENKAFAVEWKNKQAVLDTLEKLNSIAIDKSSQNDVIRLVKENNVNPNFIILSLLEFFGREKTSQQFSDFHRVVNSTITPNGQDWTGFSQDRKISLIFSFKFRRNDPLPTQQDLVASITELKKINTNAIITIVVFTNENSGLFDKLKFQFKQMLNEVSEPSSITEKIRFIPVSTSALSLFDKELTEFRRTAIEDNFTYVFTNQPPPLAFPNRNDHFLLRNFKIGGVKFSILIEPIRTPYWRFGFRFISGQTFPSLSEGRHENSEVGDIHINVGDQEGEQNLLSWKLQDELKLNEYHVDLIKDEFDIFKAYRGEPVLMLFAANDDASRTEISISINDSPIGKKTYNLSRFNYCRLFAWSDENEFDLKTRIVVSH